MNSALTLAGMIVVLAQTFWVLHLLTRIISTLERMQQQRNAAGGRESTLDVADNLRSRLLAELGSRRK